MRIQILDDEPTWREFAAATLSGAGHQVVKLRPDLVLLSSRKLDVPPRRPFVVFTGQPTTQEANQAFRAGARGYFPKDKRADRLLVIVGEYEHA